MFPLNYSELFSVPDEFKPPDDINLAEDVLYPHLNSLDYSTLRIHNIWEAIAQNRQNQLIIGTNKVTGSRRECVLWAFEDPALPLTQLNSRFHLQCESLVSQIAYLEDYVLLVAFQCGTVQLWSTRSPLCVKENPYSLFKIGEGSAHKKSVISLDVFKTNTAKAATGDKAGTLVLWSCVGNNLLLTKTCAFAHTDYLSGLDTSYTNENIIATCGYDKRAMLWDFREKKPAIALFEDHIVRFDDIAWHAAPGSQENLLTVGDETGYVHTLDVRNLRSFVQSTQLLNSPIRKIIANKDKMGVIGDSATVLVANFCDHEVLYRNEDAGSCQRDGVWRHDSELFTVGYDGKLHVHKTAKQQ